MFMMMMIMTIIYDADDHNGDIDDNDERRSVVNRQ